MVDLKAFCFNFCCKGNSYEKTRMLTQQMPRVNQACSKALSPFADPRLQHVRDGYEILTSNPWD